MNSMERAPQQPAENAEDESINFSDYPITSLMAAEAEAASRKTETKTEWGVKLRRLVGIMGLATTFAIAGSSLKRQEQGANPRNAIEQQFWHETDLLRLFLKNPEQGQQEASRNAKERLDKINRFLHRDN